MRSKTGTRGGVGHGDDPGGIAPAGSPRASEQAAWPRVSDGAFRLVDTSSPLRAGWFGERWPTRARAALVAAALAVYALAFGPLYAELGLGVTALSFLPVLLAAGLLGQRGGVAATLAVVALHTTLLNAIAGSQGGAWTALVLVQRGRGTEALALLLVAVAVGWLGDLGRRMQRQASALAREHARRGALLRVAHRVAAEADPRAVLTDLLEEASAALGADGAAAFAWEPECDRLVPVRSTLGSIAALAALPLVGAVGEAVRERRPALRNDYPRALDALPELLAAGARAALAVPIVHEARLVGALLVWTTRPRGRFEPDDAELLELLAATTATTLVSLERARLDGALLAGRTAQHEISNRLVKAVGWAELLATDPTLPPELRPHAEEVLAGARAAVKVVRQLAGLTRVEEIRWPGDHPPTIDLERSTAV